VIWRGVGSLTEEGLDDVIGGVELLSKGCDQGGVTNLTAFPDGA